MLCILTKQEKRLSINESMICYEWNGCNGNEFSCPVFSADQSAT